MIAAWLDSEWSASLRGGLALLLAWAFSALPRVPSAVRCWAWRAAYGVLVVSFFWTTPVQVAVRLAEPVITPLPQQSRAVSARSTTAGPTPPGSVTPREHLPLAAPRRPVWPTVAFSYWLVFLALYTAWLIAGLVRAQGFRWGRPIEVPELADLCRAMGVRPPAVRAHAGASGPMLVGLWRPTVVLPEPPPPQVRLILAHELSHLRRRDLLWNWLPTVAVALLPLNPLVWLCNRRWRLAAEAAADAEAVAVTAADMAEYGRLIVSTATAGRVPGVLSVAAAAESRWILRRRLSAMAHITHWNRRRRVAAGLMVAVVGTAAAVPWRVVAQPPPTTGPVAASTTPKPVPFPVSPTYTAMGQVTLPPVATLRSLATGTVTEIQLQEGGRVKQGDVLVRLDDQSQIEAVTSAQQIAKTCDDHAAAVQDMFKHGFNTTEADALQARLEAERAHDVLRQRRADLDARRIIAPCDGTVGLVTLSVGTTIVAGDAVATLTEAAATTCDFAVAEGERGTIARGTAVEVMDRSMAQVLAMGEVTTVGRAVDTSTGTIPVRVRISRAMADLWPGQFVNAGWGAPAAVPTLSPPAATAAGDPFPFAVPFEVGASRFPPGDRITVTEIRGTTADMAGGVYRISGTYRLASHETATLAGSVTARDAADGKGPWNAAQRTTVRQGSGTFTLVWPIGIRGWPHVSFYGPDDAFGGVYIGTGDSVLRKWWGD